MGIFKKNSKIATTDVSTKKSDDDMYNSACLNVAIATGNFILATCLRQKLWSALKVVNQILTSNPL